MKEIFTDDEMFLIMDKYYKTPVNEMNLCVLQSRE